MNKWIKIKLPDWTGIKRIEVSAYTPYKQIVQSERLAIRMKRGIFMKKLSLLCQINHINEMTLDPTQWCSFGSFSRNVLYFEWLQIASYARDRRTDRACVSIISGFVQTQRNFFLWRWTNLLVKHSIKMIIIPHTQQCEKKMWWSNEMLSTHSES